MHLTQSEIDGARTAILDLVRRGTELLPRIAAAPTVQEETAIARAAVGYMSAAQGLLRPFGPLYDELIDSPELLGLRRALKRYRGV